MKKAFLTPICAAFLASGLNAQIVISQAMTPEQLVQDILLGSGVQVMNITFNGIQVREEYIDLRTDEAFVAQARMDAFDRFGGLL